MTSSKSERQNLERLKNTLIEETILGPSINSDIGTNDVKLEVCLTYYHPTEIEYSRFTIELPEDLVDGYIEHLKCQQRTGTFLTASWRKI